MKYVNFGCGLSPTLGEDWSNYDGSPTLWLQRIPILGWLARKKLSPRFPNEVQYGNVVDGLPECDSTVDLVYCSHVLEHMSVQEVRIALREVFRILKPGGTFRGVLPDFQYEVQNYLENQATQPSIDFMLTNDVGLFSRSKSIKGAMVAMFGNSRHLSFWDYKSLQVELVDAGFTNVRRAHLGDSNNEIFRQCEAAERWANCLGFDAQKSE